MNGLTPTRTARLIAGLIAFVDIIFFVIYEVLCFVLKLGNEAVTAGLARYSNFTGRFAAENFAEDKKLLAMLKDAQGLLPTADLGIAILFGVVISFFLLALFGFILPKYFIAVLVKIRLLKWTNDAYVVDETSKMDQFSKKVKNFNYKKLAIPGAILGGVIVMVLFVVALSQLFGGSTEEITAELERKAVEYVDLQKDFFNKNKRVGSARDLALEEKQMTDAFNYKISKSQFLAESRMEIDGCPEGSSWKIYAKSEGFFTKELKLYRKAPADTNCVKLLPDFKNVGRKKAKTSKD